jgi:hypothetical protein
MRDFCCVELGKAIRDQPEMWQGRSAILMQQLPVLILGRRSAPAIGQNVCRTGVLADAVQVPSIAQEWESRVVQS